MPITIPADMAIDAQDALRWYGDSPEARTFLALAGANVPWRPARPRELLEWARRRQVLMTDTRLLVALVTGFNDAKRRDRMRAAIKVLREAAAAVERGDEARCMTGPGIYDLGEPPEFDPDAMWNMRDPHAANPIQQGSPADIAELRRLTAVSAVPGSAPISSPEPSSGPRFPPGTTLTRPWSSSRRTRV